MFENTVEEILTKDPITKLSFLGAFAKDELPVKPKFPSCFISNTHPRNKPGEHWLALHYDNKGYATFFDSYGKPPSYYKLENYISKSANGWSWNKRRLQGNSDLCGFYSVLFLLYKTRDKILNFFKEFYFNFSKNDYKNLKQIKNIK